MGLVLQSMLPLGLYFNSQYGTTELRWRYPLENIYTGNNLSVMAGLNASWVNHPWNLMVSCGKYGPLEPFCSHASVLFSFAYARSPSLIISLLWEIIKEKKFVVIATMQPTLLTRVIKVQCQLFKMWPSNGLYSTMLLWNPCYAASHLGSHLTLSSPSEWLCSVVWKVLPLRVKGWQGAHIIHLQELM